MFQIGICTSSSMRRAEGELASSIVETESKLVPLNYAGLAPSHGLWQISLLITIYYQEPWKIINSHGIPTASPIVCHPDWVRQDHVTI